MSYHCSIKDYTALHCHCWTSGHDEAGNNFYFPKKNFFSRFQTMSDQIIGRIDDMSGRIDDLEHNINDLMSQAGQSGPPAIEKEK